MPGSSFTVKNTMAGTLPWPQRLYLCRHIQCKLIEGYSWLDREAQLAACMSAGERNPKVLLPAQGRSVYRSMHQQDPAAYIADLEQERACTEASHYALQHDLPGCAGDCEACSGLCAHLIMTGMSMSSNDVQPWASMGHCKSVTHPQSFAQV